jgi:uncharacterized OB-fold protein
MTARQHYLPEGLPIPVPESDGLSAPHWAGLRQNQLRVQQCRHCKTFQWGPEWICHSCHSFDVDWATVEPRGVIYSWSRVWHPTHPALNEACPYITVVVELPDAGGVRVIGNLVGDPKQPVNIGAAVTGVFEQHETADPAYALLHWKVV